MLVKLHLKLEKKLIFNLLKQCLTLILEAKSIDIFIKSYISFFSITRRESVLKGNASSSKV